MSKNIYRINLLNEKSRRDGILLTVGFNLRAKNAVETRRAASLPSPAGTTLWIDKVSSLRDFGSRLTRLLRRLKPPVNKVPSLRNFPILIFMEVKKSIL